MRSQLFVSLALLLTLVACTSNRRRGIVTDTGANPDASGDTGTSADTGPVDPRCSENPFTSLSCAESQLGAQCPGTVSCECGPQPTNCECVADDVTGFAFRCGDICDCSGPVDAGVDTGPGITGDCRSAFEHLNDSECPFPLDLEELIGQCEESRTISTTCQAEWDAYNACAASAEVECLNTGELVIPTAVDCTPPSGACFPGT